MDCSRCGHELPEPTPPHCPQCGAPTAADGTPALGAPVVTFTPPPPEPPPIGGPLRDGPPWERRRSFLDLGAMGRTISGVLIDPITTFRTMKRDGGLGGPLLFFWPLTVLFTWIAVGWSVAQQRLLSETSGEAGALFDQLGVDPGALMIYQVLMAPVLTVLVWFIWSGIAHLFLMMVGGARHSFETTLRVIAYVMGATAVLQIIPMCGGVIGGLWALVAEIIGLAEAHETSTGRAAAAILLPLLLCCLCIVIGLLVAVAMGVSLLDGLKA